MNTMQKDSRIYVAGHRGLVGGAILRRLQADGYTGLITRTSAELDLRDQAAVRAFFAAEHPEFVFLAAAKVGGILANSTYPAQFLYDNLMIAANVIHAAHEHGVHKLLNLGSSCIYPRMAPQPLQESALLTGPLEDTNRAYAVAKIAAIELCDQCCITATSRTRRACGCCWRRCNPTRCTTWAPRATSRCRTTRPSTPPT